MLEGFTRKPVDYSFIPMAFSGLKKTIGQVSDMADKDRKRQEFEENLKRVKVTRENVNKAREDTIVELATQYRDAAGLPNDEKGQGRALDVMMSAIYPLTSKEMNDPDIAARRINDFELNTFPKILSKAKMARYRSKTESAPQQVRPEGATPMQQQPGQVGIEDEGMYKTVSQPQSIQDVQGQINEEKLREPYAMPTVGRTMTAQEKQDVASGIYGPEVPTSIQGDIGTTGRRELSEGEYPEGFTKQAAYGEVAKKPEINKDMDTFVKQFPDAPKPPKALTELDLAKIARLRADAARLRKMAEGGGADIKFSDLTKLQSQRNNVEKTIKDVSRAVADIDNKLRDPSKMDVEGGETAESLIQQRDALKSQLKSNKSQLPGIDNDISVVRKRLDVPAETDESDTEYEPTPEAQKVAVSIRKMMDDDNIKPNKHYRIIDRFGEQTYYNKKKKKADSNAYRSTLENQVLEYAKGKDVNLKIDTVSKALRSRTLEETIDAIIKKSKGE